MRHHGFINQVCLILSINCKHEIDWEERFFICFTLVIVDNIMTVMIMMVLVRIIFIHWIRMLQCHHKVQNAGIRLKWVDTTRFAVCRTCTYEHLSAVRRLCYSFNLLFSLFPNKHFYFLCHFPMPLYVFLFALYRLFFLRRLHITPLGFL